MNATAIARLRLRRKFAKHARLATVVYQVMLAQSIEQIFNVYPQREVWEAEQASAHTPLTGQDEDDIEVMKRDFDDVFPF